MFGKRSASVLVLGSMILSSMLLFSMSGRSDPFGSNKVVISAQWDQYSPRIAVTGSGATADIYVVWQDYQWGAGIKGDVGFSRSTDGGATFSLPMRINLAGDYLTGNNSDDGQPDIAVSGSSIYVVWLDSSQSQPHIYFKRSVDSGSTFTGEIDVFGTGTSNDAYPHVAASGSNVYITWAGKNSEGILAAMSTNGGTSFGSPVLVNASSSAFMPAHPDIALDSTYVYVAWDTNEAPWGKDGVFMSRSSLGSLSFSPALDVSQSLSSAEEWPCIAADSNGVYMAWNDYRNSAPNFDWTGQATDDSDIYFAQSTNQGSSFSAPARANDDPLGNDNQQESPTICPDTAGNAFIAWADERNGDYDVYFTHHTSTGFSTNGRVNEFSATASDQKQPSIGVAADNVAYCVWSDSRNPTKKKDIYCAHTIPNTAPNTPVMNSPDQIQADSMRLTWQGNIESDFASYEIYLSTTPGFTPSPANLNKTITNQAITTYTVPGLSAGTRYYFKMIVKDIDGLSATSNEVNNRTLSINQRPQWLKAVPPLSFNENNATQGHHLLNLSDGYFWDDFFNGFGVAFTVETTPSNAASQDIVGSVEKNGSYYYLSFTSKTNWAGSEDFWLNITDFGPDGTPSPDDLYNISAMFTVTVINVNQRPSFDKVYSGILWTETVVDHKALNLSKVMEHARQNQYFNFTVSCKDPDLPYGDAVTFAWSKIANNVSTPLTDPEADLDNPTKAADFSYRPNNDDATNIDGLTGRLEFNITVSDKAGLSSYFQLLVTADNANDNPVITTIVDGAKDVDVKTLTKDYEFEVNERQALNFSVICIDPDPKDTDNFYCDKLNMSIVSVVKYKEAYNGVPDVDHFRANFTYVATADDLLMGVFKGIKISVDDKHTGYTEMFIDLKLNNVNDPPNEPKISVRATVDNEVWQKDKGYSDMNDNEDLNFTAVATDPDFDPLTYSWEFGDGGTASGRFATHKFATVGNYSVTCTATDPGGLKNSTTLVVHVTTDDDSDNDKLPDSWEMQYFHDLSHGAGDDPDGDGFTNWDEFNMATDPTVNNNVKKDDDTTSGVGGTGIPFWIVLVIGIAVALIIFGIVVLFLVRRQNKQLEEEDKEIDAWVKKQEEKLEESKKIYGTQVAGAQAVSNIQHTQTVDINKLTEEEKMFIAVGEGKVSAGDIAAKNKPAEPEYVSAGSGPLFDNSAPKLEFSSESIKLETLSTPKDDDMVIETVTLGMQEDPDPNKHMTQGAPHRK